MPCFLYRNKCFHIREINGTILLFFDHSLEDIRKLYNNKIVFISKYLNSIYKFHCDKSLINYKPILDKKLLI